MGIYGHAFDSINESLLFVSPEVKELRQKIKDICNKVKEKFSLSKALSQEYSKQARSKVLSELSKILNPMYTSIVIKTTYTQNGISTDVSYSEYVSGIYKNKIVNIQLTLLPNGVSSGFTDEVKKPKYDIDIAKKVFQHLHPYNCDFSLLFTNAGILFKLGSKSEVDIITRDLNNKYGDDYIFKAGPLGGSISITKK